MKKICIFIVCILMIASALLTASCSNGSTDVNIKSKYINNYNNSFLSEGRATSCNGKLYFDYASKFNFLDQGIMEIGKSTRKIYSYNSVEAFNNTNELQTDGKEVLAANYCSQDYSDILESNDIAHSITNTIFCYDTKKCSLIPYITLDSSISNSVLCFYYIDDKYYYFSNDSIYESEDGIKSKQVFDNVKNIKKADKKIFYISGNSLIYIDLKNRLVNYDLKNQCINYSIKLEDYFDKTKYISKVFVCDNKIVFVVNDDESLSLYTFDDTNLITKKIYYKKASGNSYINSYKNKILVSSQDTGLDIVNITNGQTISLVKNNVEDTYAFDNKWVYYIDVNRSLYRVTYDGKITEKIYG